ncbi:hypothetical protein BGV40_03305 [Methanosarcina sp. Ant1]|nr:hypothetical protein BGV40_03305 [Methanosarcina sp. Ant1]
MELSRFDYSFILCSDIVNYEWFSMNYDKAIKVLQREITYLTYEYKLECAQAQRDGSDVNHTKYRKEIEELESAIKKLNVD